MCAADNFEKRYEKLPAFIYPDSGDASTLVAAELAQLINQRSKAGRHTVLGLSASSACIQLYQQLVHMHRQQALSFAQVIVFVVAEYYPLAPDAPQAHYRFMREYLFDHVDLSANHIYHIHGNTPRAQIADHCSAYEAALMQLGGIDVLILADGLIGFNEPGSPYNSLTRLITLNHSTRVSAASDFYGVENVPFHAVTLGVGTALAARKVYMLAWGEGSAGTVRRLVEGDIDPKVPASYLQQHKDITFYIDQAASADLTRVRTPWLTGTCQWTDTLIKKAVFWLCQALSKPILKLTDRDYNDNGMSDLVTQFGPSYKINIRVFNELQHTITGWPGGKPNADDSTRPERAAPFPKRVVVFSPHPDDDVISMGGTLARLSEHGHEVHVAYQVSGNIAVFDHDAIRFLDFVRDSSHIYGFSEDEAERIYTQTRQILKQKKPGELDPPQVQQLKAAIRRGEAKAACRYINIPEEHLHFLDLPFYDTGTVKKNPIGDEDIRIVMQLLQQVQPHQIFAAGDLSDPHGTHRVCFMAIVEALRRLHGEPWLADCKVWLYRGAWQEWDVSDAQMAVPLSPEEVAIKREAIFKHQSQKDRPLFPGSDAREFWQRAEDRNHATAVLYDKLGMAEYQAIELFVQYHF